MEEKKAWNVKNLPVKIRQQVAGEAKKQGMFVGEFITLLWERYEKNEGCNCHARQKQRGVYEAKKQ